MMDISISTAATNAINDEPPSPESHTERVGYQTSPHAPNTPENNICKLVSYRGSKVASFTVGGRELICLPQAFELFLKHLVGGLHTVYTKLKRLEITPVVCNVEQVRILRGVAAIQPGVNRCKLISPHEFDVLYEDCTSSSARPGRPPKRSSFIGDFAENSSPNKLARKSSDTNIFSIDEMKGISPPGSGFLPSFPAYPAQLPGLPFVSQYQLNLMHQAAVQMAFANQLHSNLNRVNTSDLSSFPLGLMKQSTSLHFSQQNQFKSVAGTDKESCNSEGIRSSVFRYPKSHGNQDSDQEDDGNLDSLDSKQNEQIQRANVLLGPLVSPQNTMPTPPLSSPRCTELDFTSHPSSRSTDQDIPVNKHLEQSASTDNRKPGAESSLADVSCQEFDVKIIDNLLANIQTDIKSFTESIVQHQEDILSDIDDLRRRLQNFKHDHHLLERITKEEQATKAFLKSQSEKEKDHSHRIENLLKITKNSLNSYWFNNGSAI